MTKPRSINITMPAAYWDKLQELANSNAQGVRSRMLAMLAYLATAMYDAFGLFPPSDELGNHPGVNRRLMGEGKGQRVNITLSPDDWQIVARLANANTRGFKSTLLRHLVETAYNDPGRFNLYPPAGELTYHGAVTVSQEMTALLKDRDSSLDPSVFAPPKQLED